MRIATIQGPLQIGLDYSRNVQAARANRLINPQLDVRRPHNIGDWFVTTSSDKILDYEDAVVISRNAPQADWDALNAECDILVLKGGNYVQHDWLSTTFGLELFKKVKIPVFMFGIGLQAGRSETVRFAPEEAEILRLLADRSAAISVRGGSTAEALSSIGITNAVVTGCPTTYWSLAPEISVRTPGHERASFSFRQGLYSSDPEVYRSQFRAIEAARDQFSTLSVILQGEELLMQRYHMATKWAAEYAVTAGAVEGTGLTRFRRDPVDVEALRDELHATYDGFSRPALIRWLMDNTFWSYDVGDYLDHYRSQDMVLGCRLHSNLVAIAHGTATFFLTYDQRTQEMADTFELPSCPVTTFDASIDLHEQNWSGFEKRYAHYFGEMRRVLDACGVKHRLRAG
jgi:hypothetical protein